MAARVVAAPATGLLVVVLAGAAVGVTLRALTQRQENGRAAAGVTRPLLEGQNGGIPVPPVGASEIVREPDDWIPFTAVVERSAAGRASRANIARASDGSYYRDELDTGVRTIDNQSRHLNFQYSRGTWVARPLVGGARPAGRALSLRQVTPVPQNDPRVAQLHGTELGLRFYELQGTGGGSAIYCPELNLTQVWRREPWDSGVYRFVSLVLEEPPASLFEPPNGAIVETRDTPVQRGRISDLPSKKKNENRMP